jgi:hypothetical protein
MSDMSTYLGNDLLNWIKGVSFAAAPANVYAALYNGDPDSAGSELTGTINLTRQIIAWGSVSARALSNSAEVNFGTANASGTATYVVLYDAATAGNELSKKLITTASITSGEKVAIAIGALTLSY